MSHQTPIWMRVGYVEAPQEQLAKEIEQRLEQFNTFAAPPLQLPPLAGPNEVLQLIADKVSWVNFVRLIVEGGLGAFAVTFLGQLGKRLADRVIDGPKSDTKLTAENLKGLAAILQQAQDRGLTVTLAMPVVGNKRNVGLQLSTKSPDEVIRQVVLFGAQAPEIDQMVSDEIINPSNDELLQRNDDCSTRVVMVEGGRIVLPGRRRL